MEDIRQKKIYLELLKYSMKLTHKLSLRGIYLADLETHLAIPVNIMHLG